MPITTETAAVSSRPTSWADAVTLGQVDPTLGIQSLTLTLTGTVASTVAVSNFDLVPSVFDITTAGSVVLSRPNGSAWLSTAPNLRLYGVLPAALGTAAVPVQLSGMGSTTSSVGYRPSATSSADAAMLTGTGQVTFPVGASAAVHGTGPATMTARFTSLAGAVVALTADTGPDPGGGSSSLSASFSIIGGGGNGILFHTLSGSTKSQTLTAADASIGAVSSLSFDGFEPSLGVLDGVTVSVAVDASGWAVLENLDPVASVATVGHSATVTVAGANGTALVSSKVSFTDARQMAAFDGTDDFAGASSAGISEAAPASSSTRETTTIQGAGLSAFKSGPVVLGVKRAGNTTLDGPGNLDVATALQAGAEVTVTYHYVAPVVNYTDTATGAIGTATADTYSGPVAGLQRQYIWSSPDAVAIRSAAPDVFLHGGAGADALAVSGGSNVLDGGGGSNFLVGALGADGGNDMFYLDARGGAVTWSTIVNFHVDDTATIFGFHAGVSTQPWTGSEGAIGYNGLTLHSETKGAGTGIDASLTFTGVDPATADAHWNITTGTLSPGSAGATDYLMIQWNR